MGVWIVKEKNIFLQVVFSFVHFGSLPRAVLVKMSSLYTYLVARNDL